MEKRKPIEQRDFWEMAFKEKLDGYEMKGVPIPPLQLPKEQPRWLTWPLWVAVGSVAAASLLFLFVEPKVGKKPSEWANVVESAQNNLPTEPPVDADWMAPNRQEEPQGDLASNSRRPLGTAATPQIGALSEESTLPEVIVPKAGDPEEGGTPSAEAAPSPSAPPISVPEAPECTQEDRGVTTPPTAKSHSVVSSLSNGSDKGKGLKISLNLSGLPQGGGVNSRASAMPFALLSVMDQRYFKIEKVEESYHTKEVLPIELGATLVWSLSKSWSLESGLLYSYRKLEVTPSRSPQFSMEVHAIGLPLNVQYAFFSSDHWQAYALAGFSAKWPLSTTSERDYLPPSLKTSYTIDACLGLGAEYAITEAMGLYVAIDGVYDLKPLNRLLFERTASRYHLKVKAGLRFRLNH